MSNNKHHELKLYGSFLLVLLVTNTLYKYVLNKNNRLEYYFFETNKYKYTLLKYCRIFMSISMFIYLRYVLLNLINSYKTIKWTKN
tara:strand:- start:2032 stop:2289 length:258 start_codon:yes stop_codon:yes gene_type:complete